MAKKSRLLGDLTMLLVAFIWGSTNVVIRDALSGIGPLWFNAIRFAIAFGLVALIFRRRGLALPAKDRLAGALTGMVFIASYMIANVGLQYTTAGNMSFIISMFVVFVPLTVWALTRRFPGWHVIAAMLLCCGGLVGLMVDESLSVNIGDIMAFAGMLLASAYIVLVQKLVHGADPLGLAVWQAGGGMFLAVLGAVALEAAPTEISRQAWLAIIYTASAGFALTLILQNVGQKYTTATHAAIILSTSSVFGSALGIVFLGEPMTARIFIASALILAGVVAVEAVPAIKEARLKRLGQAQGAD